jgi:hypothetical protein
VTQPAPVVDRYQMASNIRFEPPRRLNLADTIGRLPAVARRPVATGSTPRARRAERAATQAAGLTARQRARLEELRVLEEKLGASAKLRLRSGGAEVAVSAAQVLEAARGGQLSLTESIGRWVGTLQVPRLPVGAFEALADGLDGWRSVTWWVNDVLLDPQASSKEIDGVVYEYAQSGRRLRLEPRASADYEFELRVAVEDRNGKRFTTSTCVHYTGECAREVRAVPHWTRFKGLASMAT